jgi:hypothetical protein
MLNNVVSTLSQHKHSNSEGESKMGSVHDPILPETNLNEIIGDVVHDINDISGKPLIMILRNLLNMAERIQELNHRLSLVSQEIIDENNIVTEEIDSQLLDLIYDPICYKLYIAEVMNYASEMISYEISNNLTNIRKIKSIVYSETGDISSYKLE